jgi:hypothetical protein
MKPLAGRRRESDEVLAVQELSGNDALLFERSDQAQRFIAFGFEPRQGFPEQVGVLDRAFGKRTIKPFNLPFDATKSLAQLLRLRGVIMAAVFCAGDQG